VQLGGLLDAGGFAEVDHQETPIGGLQRVGQPRHGVLRRDRRQVDQLEGDVLEAQHARLGGLGGEWVWLHIGVRAGEPGVQGRLPGIRGTEQRHLAGALPAHHGGWPCPGTALAGRGELLGEVLDAAPDVASEMLGALVLGNGAEHFPQPAEPVLGSAGLAELGLGGLVLGRDIGRHLHHQGRPCETRPNGDEQARTTGGADHQMSAGRPCRVAAVTPRLGGG
jgi:hypothetical protein